MVPPSAATTPPRRGGPPPPNPYDYDNPMMSPGTPYSTRGGSGGGPPPPHSPFPSYSSGGGYRGGPPPLPLGDYWGPGPGAGESPTTSSQYRGAAGYWGPPPSGGPYHDGYRMGPPVGPPPQTRGYGGYPSYRTPVRRPFVSPGDPISPRHPHAAASTYESQQRKDFRPPAPAAASSARGPLTSIKSEDKDEKTDKRTTEVKNHKGDGDPLSVLADVSAGMDGKNKKKDGNQQSSSSKATSGAPEEDDNKKKNANREARTTETATHPPVPLPAPTSPLQRRTKTNPITPSQLPFDRNAPGSVTSILPTTPGRHQPITPSRSQDSASLAAGGSWGEAPSIPPGVSSEASYPSHEYSPHPQGPYTPVRSQRRHIDGDLPPPSDSPALVERGSFDSHGDASSYRAPPYPPATPPSRTFFYDEGPPPGYGSGNGGSYWEGAGSSPYSPSYHPPPRGGPPGWWNQPPPPPVAKSHHDPYYGMPHGPPPPDYPQGPPPPPPHYDEDPAMPPGGHFGPPPPHYRGAPPPHHHPYHHPPHHPTIHPPPPYGYVPHPRMEEKTILRKKFSWKHFPELERFLIANRDEYLKHSNMNYTAEQKQYNNWLTERLLEVAGQHNYMFDPEDFNFVSIRDRIRCYYKSYVQTARKRGLKLPEKKNE